MIFYQYVLTDDFYNKKQPMVQNAAFRGTARISLKAW
jgi:hypothetical protein